MDAHFNPKGLLVCIKFCVCVVVNKSRWKNTFELSNGTLSNKMFSSNERLW